MGAGGPTCPRCQSSNTVAGKTSQLGIILAIVGFFVVCLFSLFFLLLKDENQCYNCGIKWK